jgi:hypothetical protein
MSETDDRCIIRDEPYLALRDEKVDAVFVSNPQGTRTIEVEPVQIKAGELWAAEVKIENGQAVSGRIVSLGTQPGRWRPFTNEDLEALLVLLHADIIEPRPTAEQHIVLDAIEEQIEALVDQRRRMP